MERKAIQRKHGNFENKNLWSNIKWPHAQLEWKQKCNENWEYKNV